MFLQLIDGKPFTCKHVHMHCYACFKKKKVSVVILNVLCWIHFSSFQVQVCFFFGFFFFFFLVYSPFLLLFLSNKETFPLYFYLLYLLASHKFISSSIYSFNFLSFQIFFLVFQKKKKKNIPHPHVLNIKKKK